MTDRPFRSASLGMPPVGVVVEVRWPDGAIGKTRPARWSNLDGHNVVTDLEAVERIAPGEIVRCYTAMLTDKSGGEDDVTVQLGLVWVRERDKEVILGDSSEWRPV